MRYFPQRTPLDKPYVRRFVTNKCYSEEHIDGPCGVKDQNRHRHARLPAVFVAVCTNVFEGDYPTQKPVELLRYLVRTYTNPVKRAPDFTMGSDNPGAACAMEGVDSYLCGTGCGLLRHCTAAHRIRAAPSMEAAD